MNACARFAALALPARWPGWGGERSLVVPVPRDAWPPPASPLRHAGLAFAPKAELHVTVVGRTLGARLHAAIVAGALREADVREAFAAGPWRLRRSGRRMHLHRDATAEKPAADSIVEPVALPAMARFHHRLGALLGYTLPVPPPHVTLFVAGDGDGIGVPDREAWEGLQPRCLAEKHRG